MQHAPLRSASYLLALAAGLAGTCALAGAQGAPPTAPAPALPPSTPITLRFTQAPPRAVIESLVAQAGLEPLGRSAESVLRTKAEPITLDVQAQPFWLAVLELQKASGITFDELGSSSDDTTLTPTTGDRGLGGRLQTVGPVTFAVRSIEAARSRRVNLNADAAAPQDAGENLEVMLRAFLDPKMRIVPNSASLEILEAQDDKAQSLLETPSTLPINTSARFTLGSRLRLNAPAAGAKSLRLKGVLHVTLQEEPQVWEVADLSAPAPEKIDAQPNGKEPLQSKSLGVKDDPIQLGFDYLVQPRDRVFYARVSFQRAAAGRSFRESIDAMLGDVKLVDAQGQTVRGRSGAASGTKPSGEAKAGDQRIIAQVMFPRSGRVPQGFTPAKLVWSVPGRLRQVAIPWSFDNLPLP